MKVYNTLSREIENVKPLYNNEIKMYVCGLTVYSQPHIGNWVSYIYWDILTRVLITEGYKLNRVQNITDVGHLTSDEDSGEDKIQKGAEKEGVTAWQVAEKYINIADNEAYQQLKLLRPDHLVRATDFIEEQIKFVQDLEAKGYTYTIEDGVYFDTSKSENYGILAKLDIKGLRSGARIADSGKKNSTDFALWKFSSKQQKRDMEWSSPWGRGFPGWHLECSVMARQVLGDQIDIHVGGIDHIPVHHTNEIAQTQAITSKPFSKYWMHANHIKVNGTKMSKSIGNIVTLEDIRNKGFSLQAFKLLVLSKHYRTEGNFTWKILSSSQNRLDNWQAAADMRWQTTTNDSAIKTIDYESYCKKLLSTLQNDLDTPNALALIDEALSITSINGLGDNQAVLFDMFLDSIDKLLGINLRLEDINDEQKELLESRLRARKNNDYKTADAMRDELLAQGIGVRDKKDQQIWFRTNNGKDI